MAVRRWVILLALARRLPSAAAAAEHSPHTALIQIGQNDDSLDCNLAWLSL